MNEFFKIALLCISLGFVTSCSKVLQTVDLEVDSEDNSSQKEFIVVEKKLMIKEENARFLTIKPIKYMLGFSDPTNTNKEDFKGKISPLKEIKIETY